MKRFLGLLITMVFTSLFYSCSKPDIEEGLSGALTSGISNIEEPSERSAIFYVDYFYTGGLPIMVTINGENKWISAKAPSGGPNPNDTIYARFDFVPSYYDSTYNYTTTGGVLSLPSGQTTATEGTSYVYVTLN